MRMDYNELGFDTEFISDGEVEQMIDYIIAEAVKGNSSDENDISIINPNKINQVLYTYKVLKYLFRGIKGVKVDYDLHEPYLSMGSVSVIGKNLLCKKPEWFMKAVEFSDNFEVYPKTDGTVQMDFTFHGLTKSIN